MCQPGTATEAGVCSNLEAGVQDISRYGATQDDAETMCSCRDSSLFVFLSVALSADVDLT